MPAAQYDLTREYRRNLEQGYQFGPFNFTIRNGENDTWTVTISTVGNPGDVHSVTVFGALSDDPSLETTVSYVVQVGDNSEDVARELSSLLGAISETDSDGVTYSLESSYDSNVVTVSTSDVTVDGETTRAAFYLDLSSAATGAGANVAANTVSVLIDLTSAEIYAEGRDYHGSTTSLFQWSSTGPSPQYTITDAVRSRYSLTVPDTETVLYTWETGFYEQGIRFGTGVDTKFFRGIVENELSLRLP